MPFIRSALVLAVTLAATVAPGTALAKGGGSAPPPPVAQAQCDHSQDGVNASGARIVTMPVNNAGCVSVISTGTTLNRYAVTPAAGWTYAIKANGGGTNSRVEVQFANPTTGERVALRYQFGLTEIK